MEGNIKINIDDWELARYAGAGTSQKAKGLAETAVKIFQENGAAADFVRTGCYALQKLKREFFLACALENGKYLAITYPVFRGGDHTRRISELFYFYSLSSTLDYYANIGRLCDTYVPFDDVPRDDMSEEEKEEIMMRALKIYHANETELPKIIAVL